MLLRLIKKYDLIINRLLPFIKNFILLCHKRKQYLIIIKREKYSINKTAIYQLLSQTVTFYDYHT